MTIHLCAVPSHAGGFFPGTEVAPDAIRAAGLVNRLERLGHRVVDHGDLIDPRTLPRHNNGSIRNWPAPKIVWEELIRRREVLFNRDAFSLLLGGDCSMIVGSFIAFRQIHGDNCYLLVLDGHIDALAPSAEKCVGAAAMGLWFLTHCHAGFWDGPVVDSSSICVMGSRSVPTDATELHAIGAGQLEGDSGSSALRAYFESLPVDARIFVHFDVDVLSKDVMPAAYSPNDQGMGIDLVRKTLRTIFDDARVKGIEVCEFFPSKDPSGSSAQVIVDLLAEYTIKG